MIPRDATHLVRGFSRAPHRLLLETWHRGEASKDTEVAAWRERMKRGEVAYLEIVDLRTHETHRIYGQGPEDQR